ncbi:MAG: phosphatidylserine decarboxylase family protein, partial [Porphyromonas sp.]|nr:phosphatidylserine decarboxylase family protein [Porphyromonas sp.]
MLLHKEGRGPLIGFAITLIGLNAFIALFAGGTFSYIFLAISILFYLAVIN